MRYCANHALVLAPVLLLTVGSTRTAAGATLGKFEREGKPREGLVYFGFADFGQGHVDNTLPILEKYDLKGTFHTNMGRIKAGSPLWNKMREMARAGHCFVDHTLEHRASDWGEKPNEAEWLRQTTESLRRFREAGIDVHGWWQPGGPGAKYTPAIRNFLTEHYRWAWAMHEAYPRRHRPVHWHFAGDLYNFVIGGAGGMDYAKDQAGAQRGIDRFKTAAADRVAQGMVVLYGGHHTPPGIKQWGLEQACRYIRKAGFRTATLNEALYACTHTREFYHEFCEQMPNATLELDRDANGRPDGWFGCAYAPEGIRGPDGQRVALAKGAVHTALYGPEAGKSGPRFLARSSAETPTRLVLTVHAVVVGGNFADSPTRELVRQAVTIGKSWQPIALEIVVPERTDRLAIRVSPAQDGFFLAAPSFRRVP